MGSQGPVSHGAGLEVDWRQHQAELEQPHKQQPDNEGLQHIRAPYSSADAGNHSDAHSQRILGLSIGMFWFVVAVIVLVLAGGIGGGVAGGLAAQKHSCSDSPSTSTSVTPASTPSSSLYSSSASSTSSASSISSAPTGVPSPAISSPCNGNSAVNGSVLIARDPTGTNSVIADTQHAFQLLCNTQYPAGTAYGNPNVIDLLHIYTPDLAGCIEACVEYNIGNAVANGGLRCLSVSVTKAPGKYCYLKSAVGKNDTSVGGDAPVDSAILIA